MHSVSVVALPPCQNNIYFTLKLNLDIKDYTDGIVQEFSQMRLNFPKTIVFVRSYVDCIIVYQLLKKGN